MLAELGKCAHVPRWNDAQWDRMYDNGSQFFGSFFNST
jgi:hypothetical protein